MLCIIRIIAEKHSGKTEADNLALSCVLCNKYKGSDIASVDPETGKVVPLYHPRQQKWTEHFSWQNGEFIPLNDIGHVTIRLLQLNRSERIAERQLLFQAKLLNIST